MTPRDATNPRARICNTRYQMDAKEGLSVVFIRQGIAHLPEIEEWVHAAVYASIAG